MGETRAKYGNRLIKEYSERLTKELGKEYGISSLKNMRQFYLLFQKGAPLSHLFENLTWSHYKLILPIKNVHEIKYYLYIVSKLNLSKRELTERI